MLKSFNEKNKNLVERLITFFSLSVHMNRARYRMQTHVEYTKN